MADQNKPAFDPKGSIDAKPEFDPSGEVQAAPPPGEKPILSKGPDDAWETLLREGRHLAEMPKGIAKGLYHAFADPETPEEKQEREGKEAAGGTQPNDPISRGIYRLTGQPVKVAADWYTKVAKGQVPNAYEHALSVAPEAMAEGAGGVLLPKVAKELPGMAEETRGSMDPDVSSARFRAAQPPRAPLAPRDTGAGPVIGTEGTPPGEVAAQQAKFQARVTANAENAPKLNAIRLSTVAKVNQELGVKFPEVTKMTAEERQFTNLDTFIKKAADRATGKNQMAQVMEDPQVQNKLTVALNRSGIPWVDAKARVARYVEDLKNPPATPKFSDAKLSGDVKGANDAFTKARAKLPNGTLSEQMKLADEIQRGVK